MYNYKYYRYYIELCNFLESSDRYSPNNRDKTLLFENIKISIVDIYPIMYNMRNYHIDKLNKFGEYERNNYVLCMKNFILVGRIQHSLTLSTDRYAYTGNIIIYIEYISRINGMHRISKVDVTLTVSSLTPISQL